MDDNTRAEQVVVGAGFIAGVVGINDGEGRIGAIRNLVDKFFLHEALPERADFAFAAGFGGVIGAHQEACNIERLRQYVLLHARGRLLGRQRAGAEEN